VAEVITFAGYCLLHLFVIPHIFTKLTQSDVLHCIFIVAVHYNAVFVTVLNLLWPIFYPGPINYEYNCWLFADTSCTLYSWFCSQWSLLCKNTCIEIVVCEYHYI